MGKMQYIFLGIGFMLIGLLYFFVRPATRPTFAPTTPKQQKDFTLKIKQKKLVSGPETITVSEGDRVVITVISDEDEELHLHGYDKIVELSTSVPASLLFTATLTGRFEYELEHAKITLGALNVLPR